MTRQAGANTPLSHSLSSWSSTVSGQSLPVLSLRSPGFPGRGTHPGDPRPAGTCPVGTGRPAAPAQAAECSLRSPGGQEPRSSAGCFRAAGSAFAADPTGSKRPFQAPREDRVRDTGNPNGGRSRETRRTRRRRPRKVRSSFCFGLRSPVAYRKESPFKTADFTG